MLTPHSSIVLNAPPPIGFRMAFASVFLALLAVTGCKSPGPKSVTRDRMHYSSAVAESWKEQLLLNIVKTRYADTPAFLEVASVIAGYTLETEAGLGGQVSPESLRGDTFVTGGVSATYTDRPTISYTPMKGEKFARSLIAPVPLDALLFVTEGGIPAERLLGLTLQTLEGHHNLSFSIEGLEPPDPEFIRSLQLIGALRRARAAETEVIKHGEQTEIWLQFRPLKASATLPAAQAADLKKLLGIPAELDRARVVFGNLAAEPETIGMRTRSLMQILVALGAGVQIPLDHLADGRAVPVVDSSKQTGFTVKSGKKEPDDAFVAVPYEGSWFWIDRQDLASKSIFLVVTVMFNFLEAGGSTATPVLTIPTN